MSAPSVGRRRWAAKRRTACSSSARAPPNGSNAEPAPRPLPKIFRLTKGSKLIEGIFKGETINTPSMLCVEDWLFALDWAERIGGLYALIARADANAAALDSWVQSARLDRASGGRPGDPLEHLGLPAFADRSDDDGNRRGRRPWPIARARGRGVRHRWLSRRSARTSHLVRGNCRNGRHRSARPVARLGVGGARR